METMVYLPDEYIRTPSAVSESKQSKAGFTHSHVKVGRKERMEGRREGGGMPGLRQWLKSQGRACFRHSWIQESDAVCGT